MSCNDYFEKFFCSSIYDEEIKFMFFEYIGVWLGYVKLGLNICFYLVRVLLFRTYLDLEFVFVYLLNLCFFKLLGYFFLDEIFFFCY